jgi:hypothetical protein
VRCSTVPRMTVESPSSAIQAVPASRAATQPAVPADRFAHEIVGILTVMVMRSQRLNGNPLARWRERLVPDIMPLSHNHNTPPYHHRSIMPLQQINILRWHLSIDPEATRQAHEPLEVGCDCAYCRNFLAVLIQLPKQIFDILQVLGINSAKPAEIVHYTQNADGTHFYSWWYHAIGQMTDCQGGNDAHKQAELAPNVTLSITTETNLVPTSFPRPVFQIEFFSNLACALDEEPDG